MLPGSEWKLEPYEVFGESPRASKRLLIESDGCQGGWLEEEKENEEILLEERGACSLVAVGLATLSLV